MSAQLKSVLFSYGFDAETVFDEGLQGAADSTIASHCRTENRILLTLDLGFGDLRKYTPGTHPGIIVFRPVSSGPAAVKALVTQFFSTASLVEFQECIAIVEPDRVRIRRPEGR
jgi:predicted nuclease of predicted toxin-antitoxin system